MKTFSIKTLFIVSFLLCFVSSNAQTSISKPDQKKLIKQFEGHWKAVTGNDTLITASYQAFGNGLDGISSIKTGSATPKEGRQLFGYDPATDTFIEAEMTTASDIELWACWFISDKIFMGVPLADLQNPSKAIYKVEIIIQSPDIFVQNIYQNNKVVGKKTMKRINPVEGK